MLFNSSTSSSFKLSTSTILSRKFERSITSFFRAVVDTIVEQEARTENNSCFVLSLPASFKRCDQSSNSETRIICFVKWSILGEENVGEGRRAGMSSTSMELLSDIVVTQTLSPLQSYFITPWSKHKYTNVIFGCVTQIGFSSLLASHGCQWEWIFL